MPYLKKIERPHQCMLPTGRHSRGSGSVGSIWQCPTCKRCYEVQPIPAQDKPAFVEISEELAKNLARLFPVEIAWKDWKHPCIIVGLECDDGQDEGRLVARLIVKGREGWSLSPHPFIEESTYEGIVKEDPFVGNWRKRAEALGFGFVDATENEK